MSEEFIILSNLDNPLVDISSFAFVGSIDLHKRSLGTEMHINVHGTQVTRHVGMNTTET
jgi:hypothetical protein